MKDFIYNEMMVHTALCTNKTPKNILVISNNASALVKEVTKHDSIECKVIEEELDFLRNIEDNSYDVIVSEMKTDPALVAHMNRVLQDDGLLITTHPALENFEENKVIMTMLARYAKIIMPFNIGNGSTLLLASKEYHPTADIILHRADMLDNLDYYNCDVHPAAFAMGNHIRKKYLGIIKN